MEIRGKLNNIRFTSNANNQHQTEILLDGWLDFDNEKAKTLVDKEIVLKLTKYSKRRSLDANAYFHVLCDELRQAIGISMAHEKNDLITTYGQIDYLSEGVPIVYKTNAPPEYICEREEIHLKYIKSVDDTYFYKVYRGSHTYDTKEMAQLIDGTILECKAHGIETMSPEQLMRLKQAWNNGGNQNE